ncbi:hypothetical protein Aduo_002776 [Ancylostoma duodenale]
MYHCQDASSSKGSSRSDRKESNSSRSSRKKSKSGKSGRKKPTFSCKRKKAAKDPLDDQHQDTPSRKEEGQSKGKKLAKPKKSKLPEPLQNLTKAFKGKKKPKEPLKDQCQVFTLDDDIATPSQLAKLGATESLRLEAIEAVERDIEKERQEIAKEKEKIGRFWHNVNVQPFSRYLLSLPPLSWSYVSVLVCCAAKIIFCLYIFSMLLHSYDAPLLYMMCFIIVHVGSAFATIELLVMRTKKMLLICAAVDICVIIIAIVLLAVISSDKDGEFIIPVERVAATTIVLSFLEILCLVHHYHVHYRKRAAKKQADVDVELPCTCRIEDPVDLTDSNRRTIRSRGGSTRQKRKHSRTRKPKRHVEDRSSFRESEPCTCSQGSHGSIEIPIERVSHSEAEEPHAEAPSSLRETEQCTCSHGPYRAMTVPLQSVSHVGAHEYRETPGGYTYCEFSRSDSNLPPRYVRNPYTGEIRLLSHSSL